jgi:competence ComEA-like helix-hairpin-helix protein
VPPLADRINPNTAAVGSLVRLPGVGITRANAIAAYRDAHERQGGAPVFRNCDDLQEVSGIGPVTAANICPYLVFE